MADLKGIVQGLGECVNELLGDELVEGINDPYIFKAIFTAGGPGSGKSFIAKQMFSGTGMKFSNSDAPFEYLLKKRGLSFKIDPTKEKMFAKQGQARGRAKELSGGRQAMWIDGMLGMVIDGTGKDYKKITKQAAKFKAAGYDVGMVFVNTSLKVAQQRNRDRARSVPDEIVEKGWRQVQSNMGRFQRFFGPKNFYIVDNSKALNKAEIQKLGRTLRRYALNWAGKPIANPVGKDIVDKLRSTGGKTMADLRAATQLAADKHWEFIGTCLME